jgi:hypothetical protein
VIQMTEARALRRSVNLVSWAWNRRITGHRHEIVSLRQTILESVTATLDESSRSRAGQFGEDSAAFEMRNEAIDWFTIWSNALRSYFLRADLIGGNA